MNRTQKKRLFQGLLAMGIVLLVLSLLCRVIRIRDPVLVQAYKEQHDERNTMICEKAAARAARVMQGAVLYFGAAYARFLELPMWITWGLVGFCLAWGLLEWGLTLWYRHRM